MKENEIDYDKRFREAFEALIKIALNARGKDISKKVIRISEAQLENLDRKNHRPAKNP